MVFTLFNKPSYDIFYTTSRGNFNTRGFATINILEPPIAAGFFYIKIDNKNENENENDDHDNERRTSGTENDDHDNERRASGTECSTSGSTSKQEKTQKTQKKNKKR